MIETLVKNPLLLLFIVASMGYLIGAIKIKGSSLGVAAVLFTGLAFGAIDDRLQIPEVITLLGLILFVYSIGLSSGPAFFKSYQKNGFRDFIFIMSMLLFSGLVAISIFWMFGLSAATITGVYCGGTTNTPALAGVIDHITNSKHPDGKFLTDQAVIGYSLSYPMGVLGGIFSILIMERVLKIDYKKERQALRKEYPISEKLSSATLKVTNRTIAGTTIRDLHKNNDLPVVFSRIIKGEKTSLINWDTELEYGDIVMIVGDSDDLLLAIELLGEKTRTNLEYDRNQFDVRRIFVSDPKVVGHRLASLHVEKKYNAVISRIRRGDVEMIATPETVLELGDRLRFIARRKDLKALSKFFGDSYTASSKVNLFSFGLGIGIGLILGTIEFSIGPGFSFKLGYAGGPLIVGLLLGALRRTGPVVWTLPYSANITLQQIGLILLLAGIGVTSGSSFISSLSLDSVWIFMASIIISMLTGIAILLIGYRLVKLPFSLLMGMVSNQPAILDFALSKSGNRIPEFGYTMMFPIAAIMKILIAQLMFIILMG